MENSFLCFRIFKAASVLMVFYIEKLYFLVFVSYSGKVAYLRRQPNTRKVEVTVIDPIFKSFFNSEKVGNNKKKLMVGTFLSLQSIYQVKRVSAPSRCL